MIYLFHKISSDNGLKNEENLSVQDTVGKSEPNITATFPHSFQIIKLNNQSEVS